MNGFDRVGDGENKWFHGPRSLSPTPEGYAADLWSKVIELKNAISTPAKTRPWQKTMNFVDGIKEKLSNEELAVVKRHLEERSREAAKAQVTVTPVDTVQYCSPSPQTPEPLPDVCAELENNGGRMNPERGELEPPSAGTGLETPGQQCPPNEGTWEKGRTTADAIRSLAWDRTKRETFLRLRRNAWTREPSEQRQTSLSCSRATSPKTRIKAAKRTSSLTLVKKERRHRFGTRLQLIVFFFQWGERWAMGDLLLVLRVFFLCVPVCSVL